MDAVSRSRPRIALLINQVDGNYQSPIWHAIDAVCAARNCDLLVFAGKAPDSPLEEESRYNTIYGLARAELLDGIIVTSGTLSNYIGKEAFAEFCAAYSGIPLVSISQPMENRDSVVIDNYSGMKEAVSHLTGGHGLTRIAFIRGPATNNEAEERFKAYTDALAEAGIPINERLIYRGDFREFTARAAVRFWIDEIKVMPEALVAANDDMAMAAYDELIKRGLRIPEDIRLTGFDDQEAVKHYDPPFTTVSQPLAAQGEKAANLLLDRIAGIKAGSGGNETRLPARLVVRRSCGCPALEGCDSGRPSYMEGKNQDGESPDVAPPHRRQPEQSFFRSANDRRPGKNPFCFRHRRGVSEPV
jgi:sigma-B regulation protein RsbU (phosphoserine phosphatase)